jgi:hypothetical protein
MFSCVVIESSFDPGERLQALGSLDEANEADIVDKNDYTMVDGRIIAKNSERGLPNDQYIKILHQMSK